MMNKKGIKLLGEHTVNIVISVLVIVLLITVIVSLYGLTYGEADLKKAEDNLKRFVEDYDFYIKGEDLEKEFMFLGPKDWHVLFYEGVAMPNKCRNYANCVCICNGDEKEDCDSEGVCLDFKYETGGQVDYEIDEIPFTITFYRDEEGSAE